MSPFTISKGLEFETFNNQTGLNKRYISGLSAYES